MTLIIIFVLCYNSDDPKCKYDEQYNDNLEITGDVRFENGAFKNEQINNQ